MVFLKKEKGKPIANTGNLPKPTVLHWLTLTWVLFNCLRTVLSGNCARAASLSWKLKVGFTAQLWYLPEHNCILNLVPGRLNP
jgi:hypothetical protein